jgi:hypothetical protein
VPSASMQTSLFLQQSSRGALRHSFPGTKFEIPDVIAFADFKSAAAQIAESTCATLQDHTWGSALRFPYPNGEKLREMVVLGPIDLAIIRASTGRIATRVESRLSPRVWGYRTESSDGIWKFLGPRSAQWRNFIDASVRLLSREDVNTMCLTDIAAYYPSINLDRMEDRLHDIGCDTSAITTVLSGLRTWVSRDLVKGLPIGPEACGVLGNAFLIPVDDILTQVGSKHHRWMDDFHIMASDSAQCQSYLSEFDSILHSNDLIRSEKKTEHYSDVPSAIRALREGKLASLGYLLSSGSTVSTYDLHESYERDLVGNREIPRSRFRFVLNNLRKNRDACAAESLANNIDLANIDPMCSAAYLSEVGMTKSWITDAMLSRLSETPDDGRDALDLHWLRAMTRRRSRWGSEEGALFERIAEDEFRRPPIRCWAVKALSQTPAWRPQHLMESTEAERDELTQRAKLTTFTKLANGRRRTQFMQLVRDRFPRLVHTVNWLANAA